MILSNFLYIKTSHLIIYSYDLNDHNEVFSSSILCLLINKIVKEGTSIKYLLTAHGVN